MITAKEAKRLTDEAKVDIRINNKIVEAANNGVREVEFKTFELDKILIDKLIKLGYNVKENMGGGGAYQDTFL